MDTLENQYPKTAAFVDRLQPFIVIRGDKHLILKFSDNRESLKLSYEKIEAFERSESQDLLNL